MRVEYQPMGHQVATIWPVPGERMKADPGARTAQKRNDGREAHEEFKINQAVDAKLPHFENRAQTPDGELKGCSSRHSDHVLAWDHSNNVEDESVIGEDDKVDVVPPDHGSGAADGRVGKNGRAL